MSQDRLGPGILVASDLGDYRRAFGCGQKSAKMSPDDIIIFWPNEKFVVYFSFIVMFSFAVTNLNDPFCSMSIIASCAEDEFTCLSGVCIPDSWECDSEGDCPDGDDEHVFCDYGKSTYNNFLPCVKSRSWAKRKRQLVVQRSHEWLIFTNPFIRKTHSKNSRVGRVSTNVCNNYDPESVSNWSRICVKLTPQKCGKQDKRSRVKSVSN